jgi:hypothetical protein
MWTDRTLAVAGMIWLAMFPSAALPWNTTTDRGLTVFIVETPELTLSLVCDTGERHGVNASALHLSTRDGSLFSGPTTFRFAAGDVSVEAGYGSILKTAVPAGQWQALVSGLKDEPTFVVQLGDTDERFQVGSPLLADC